MKNNKKRNKLKRDKDQMLYLKQKLEIKHLIEFTKTKFQDQVLIRLKVN
jgi:hypothetical protein